LDIAREGLRQDIPVFAATPHSSAIKALAMLGMGSKNIKFIKTLPDREAIDTNDLKEKFKKIKGNPAILISSGGTVNSGDFDDMQKIAELKHKFNFWWHIDAAFGGFAACSPQYSHLLDGWENADSITVDGHKWLNVPYDSGIFLTKKSYARLQFQNFQNSNAPYLEDPAEIFSYLNFLPENSRRFRALPAWFSLMAYGKQGYRDIVENNMKLAQKLGKLIEESEIFELAAPVRLNIVCFTFKKTAEEEGKSLVKKFLDVLNRRGIVFLTSTVYQNISCIRAALVNWRTTEADIEITFRELRHVYQLLSA
jgi:glutamate/tyrosine decarboxylase-like PLP-dependent enzyme